MRNNFLVPLVIVITLFVVYVIVFPPQLSKTSNETCLDCSHLTPSTLETGLIHRMTYEYRSNQLKDINDNGFSSNSLGDSKHLWLNYETVKSFLHYMECSLNGELFTPADLGIRIYYSSYMKANEFRDFDDLVNPDTNDLIIPSTYENRHTLIMVPTIRREGIDMDFNPLDPGTVTKPLTSIPTYLDPLSDQPFLVLGVHEFNLDNTNNQGALNHGSIFPPGGGQGATFDN